MKRSKPKQPPEFPRRVELVAEFKRVVDHHRTLAGGGPRAFELDWGPDDRWRLTIDGVVVSEWSERDASGFGMCLWRILLEWNSGLHLGRSDIALQKKRVDGARKGGKARRKKTRSTVEQLMRAAKRRGEDPSPHFADWANEYG